MQKDVIVSVSGMQFAFQNMLPVEIIAAGEYYDKNGKTLVRYEEVSAEGTDRGATSENTIKLGDNSVELIKRGISSTHMVFEKGKHHMAAYSMPFGNLMIGIYTKDISITKEEDWMEIRILYSLDVNYSHVSDCQIIIKVVSKSP